MNVFLSTLRYSVRPTTMGNGSRKIEQHERTPAKPKFQGVMQPVAPTPSTKKSNDK